MNLNRLSFAIACSLAVAHASAGVAFTKCPPFGTEPNYFSGTNCRAHYTAELTGLTKHIARQKMTINGEVVKDQSYPFPTGSKPAYLRRVDPLVMWDSTHFDDGDYAVVMLEVWTTSDGVNLDYSVDSYSAEVENKGAVFCRNEPAIPDNASAVAGYLSGMNYFTTEVHTDPWDDFYIDMILGGANVLSVTTHGWPDKHATNLALTPETSHSHVTPRFYNQIRTSHVGQGAPPYNSGYPPVNYAFLHACLCGQSNNFNPILLPFVNSYGGWTENQSLQTFKWYVRIDQTLMTTDAIYGQLTQRKTTEQARDFLIENTTALLTEDPTAIPVVEREIEIDDAPLWGDFDTRLSGVYTGSDVPSAQVWFLVIQ